MANLSLTQVVAAIVASAFGLACAALFLLLGLRGSLSPEFLGGIITGVVTAVFTAAGFSIGHTQATNAITTAVGAVAAASQTTGGPALVPVPGLHSDQAS